MSPRFETSDVTEVEAEVDKTLQFEVILGNSFKNNRQIAEIIQIRAPNSNLFGESKSDYRRDRADKISPKFKNGRTLDTTIDNGQTLDGAELIIELPNEGGQTAQGRRGDGDDYKHDTVG